MKIQDSFRDLFSLPNEGSKLDNWFQPGRFGLILGLIFFITFPGVLLGTQTFVIRDYGFFGYPLAHYFRECFWRGEIPLLNPLSSCGLPFMAQWNTLVFYPGSLFYLIFPLSWALGVFCIGHLFLGGMGMYFLAHRWTGSRFAACVAGLVFAFNGLSLNCLMWPNNSAALGWMPWILLTSETGWLEGRRKLLIAIFCGAMGMLTGAPEVILLTWLLTAGLWLGKFWRGDHSRGLVFRRFIIQVVVVGALAFIQLLPFLQLLSLSQRDRSFSASSWPMPQTGWFNFLIPMLGTKPTAQNVYFQLGQYWTNSYYVGVGIFMLALLGVWRQRSQRALFLGIATGLSLIMALGDDGYLFKFVRQIFPAMGFFRYPIKLVVAAVFCLPLLAAFTVAKYHQLPRERMARDWRAIWGVGVVGLILMAVVLWLSPKHPTEVHVDENTLENTLTRMVFLAITLASLFACWRAKELKLRWALGLFLLLMIWLDIYTHVPPQNPTVDPSVYEGNVIRTRLDLKPQPEVGKSRVMVSVTADEKMYRTTITEPDANFLSNRVALWSNCNLLDDIPKINGFFSLFPREQDDVFTILYGRLDANYPRIEDFMGVSHELHLNLDTQDGDKVFDWQVRPTAMPLITAGQRPVFADRAETLRGLMSTNFQPQTTVYLPAAAANQVTVSVQTKAQVISQKWSAHRIEAEVECAEPSLIVLSQTWYPAWKATLDGQPVPIYRANHAFQAIQSPAGHHVLKLVYEDRAFYLGALISGVALLGCIAGWRRWQ